jgi:hypothetical protein
MNRTRIDTHDFNASHSGRFDAVLEDEFPNVLSQHYWFACRLKRDAIASSSC